MKIFGDVNISEGGEIINAVVASGTSDPSSNPDPGELFFRTDLNALRVYNGTTWSSLATTGGGGSVTSVALADGSSTPIYTITNSPVTSTGTLTFTFISQPANKVLAGPATGSSVQPTFRSLVVADLPNIPYDLSFFFAGNMAYASVVTGAYLASRVVTLPAGASGSLAKCGVASAATVTYSLQQNGTEVGTVQFLSGNTTGTVTIASQVVLSIGDIFTVVTPGTVEENIQNVYITIIGTAPV